MPKIIDDDQVYLAALQTVMERGYAGATTKQIAETANMSEVTLFRKYGSKAELIRQAMTAMAEQLDFESETRYTGDVRGDLLRVVEMYQETAEEKGQFIYTIILEVQRYPELEEAVAKPVEMFKRIGQLLARYQEEGVLKQEHPMQALAGLLGPLIATNIMRSAAKDIPFPPLDLAAHVQFFLNGRYQSSK
ncbi:MAG: TetR/AcrR family transcriptional regulator [Candidatus Promineifilaceae bacterium]|nr:TetR/AcrR family transcriptional regulator [Candidatus Promineifilaceae bacterium]